MIACLKRKFSLFYPVSNEEADVTSQFIGSRGQRYDLEEATTAETNGLRLPLPNCGSLGIP